MLIRAAVPEDAPAISALIRSVAGAFLLHPDGAGAEAFLATITREAIAGYIASPDFNYRAGILDGALAGVVAIRDNRHLYHLFVAPERQGQGLAKQLWLDAKAEAVRRGNPGTFTVNSTPIAVPVYQSFGFSAAGDRVETHGIAFVPMRLGLPDAPP